MSSSASKNNLYLQTVNYYDIDSIWHLIADKFSRVERNTFGKYKQSDILQQIKTEKQQTWLARDIQTDEIKMVCLTQILSYPQGDGVLIFYVAGSQRKQWYWILENIIEWAKDIGCKWIDIEARMGWKKDPELEDFKQKINFTLEL
jgi:GNAT superfamily N-acetyltransferase